MEEFNEKWLIAANLIESELKSNGYKRFNMPNEEELCELSKNVVDVANEQWVYWIGVGIWKEILKKVEYESFEEYKLLFDSVYTIIKSVFKNDEVFINSKI